MSINRNVIRILAFSAVTLLYLWFPWSMIQQQERILHDGAYYLFRPEIADPYDAFRGRFLQVSFNNRLETPLSFELGEVAYVSVGKGDDGMGYFSGISKATPAVGDYLKTTVMYQDKKRLTFVLPDNLLRYYLNEKKAPLAEELYQKGLLRERDSTSVDVTIGLRFLKGEVLIEQVFFNGEPVESYVTKNR